MITIEQLEERVSSLTDDVERMQKLNNANIRALNEKIKNGGGGGGGSFWVD